MRRKVYDQLKKWKEEQNGESAVLINGARRVGKSYIVKEFAQEEYKSYILLDFNKIGKNIKSLFETYLDDLDTFFMYLSSFTNTPLYPRESVIIFDEVQLYPRARTAIKYLVEDGRYDYIETGSLVSIKKNVEDIMIPSEEEEILMYPMDFEEFLWALNNETLMPLIRMNFQKKHEMGQMMHRNHIGIHDTDMSHASRSEVEGNWGTQSSGTNDEHLGIEELFLPLEAYILKEDVAAVSFYLFFC